MHGLFSRCKEQVGVRGCSLVAARRLLIAVFSLVVEHGL